MTTWNQGFMRFHLDETEGSNLFTTFIDESEVSDRSVSDIIVDSLIEKQTRNFEVLFSGGSDSEFVIYSCVSRKVPVTAVTMDIRVDGFTINTHDLYYAQKFCVEHNIKQRLIKFHADKFYNSGKYLEYLNPYKIIYPHVASHFWLIEQCESFPIIGGGWPWVQIHKEQKVLSPCRYSFSCYEKFMADRGMYGIGNMLGHTFDSSYKLMEIQMKVYNTDDNDSTLKRKLYKSLNPSYEPRLKSYGWEDGTSKFSLRSIHSRLTVQYKMHNHRIVWGDKVKTLLNTTLSENDSFT